MPSSAPDDPVPRDFLELLNEAANKNIRNYGRVRSERKPEPKSTLKFPSAVVAARGMLKTKVDSARLTALRDVVGGGSVEVTTPGPLAR